MTYAELNKQTDSVHYKMKQSFFPQYQHCMDMLMWEVDRFIEGSQ